MQPTGNFFTTVPINFIISAISLQFVRKSVNAGGSRPIYKPLFQYNQYKLSA